MTKQKVVFKVSLGDEKKRSKALKVAVGFPGVTKAEVQGDDKSKLSIEGEGLDVSKLTKGLRKKLGNGAVDLVSFQASDKDKDKEKMKKIEEIFYGHGYLPVNPQPGYWAPPYATPAHSYYAPQVYADPYYDDTPRCTIM